MFDIALAIPKAGASLNVTGVLSASVVPASLLPEVLMPLSDISLILLPAGLCAVAVAVFSYGPKFSPGVTVNCSKIVSLAATSRF